MNGNKLKSRLLTSSVIAGAVLGLVSAPAFAQDADEEEARQQTVTVTGSRIQQNNFTSSTPVSVFNSEQIDLTGAVNTAEILRTLPAAGVSGLTSTNSNFFTQGSGINSVELRELTEDRTLVLVNGRRFVSGVPGANTVDFNSIPTELIERVDVVTGGASSVYGSDALAGVVNVILKSDFEGVVASVQGGISDYEDDENFSASTTFGSNFDGGRGNALASVTWSTENGVYARDRGEQGRAVDGFSEAFFSDGDWTQSRVPFYSSFSERGRIIVPGFQAAGEDAIFPSDQNTVFDETDGTVRNFVSANADGSELDGFNRQAFRAIAVPTERFLFSSILNYEINPSANIFFEGTFATTDTESDIEPFPLGSDDIFGGDQAQFVDTDGDGFSDASINGISILNPFVSDDLAQRARDGAVAQGQAEALVAACEAAGITAPLTPENCNTGLVTPGAPIAFADEDLVVGFARRTSELDQRGASNTRQTARFVLGLDGKIPQSETWSYETSINFGRTTQSQQSSGQINVVNFRNALNVETDGEGNLICADPIARAEGCAPINIFGRGAISRAAGDYVKAPSSIQAEISQFVWNGFVSGELPVTLATAEDPFKMVFGSEYRSERSESVPDALSQVGLNAGNISPIVKGDFQVIEAFAEFELPLIQKRPLVEELVLNLSARGSNYTTVGDTFAWSANLQYAPVESIRFRGQYSEAVRAPNISELFQPLSETFEGGDDPCRGATLSGGAPAFLNTANAAGSGVDAASVGSATALACLADPLVASRVARDGAFVPSQTEDQGIGGFNGGNTELSEENAQTVTLGVVFTPDTGRDWVDRFAVSVDYYDIEIEDAIAGLGRQTSLDECYVNSGGVYDPSSVFCQNIVRFGNGPFTGAVDELNAVQQNLATINVAGVDVQASYVLPLDFFGGGRDFGELTTTLNYGYLDKWEQESFPGAEVLDFQNTSGLPEHEFLLGLVYRNGPVTVAYDANYLGGVDDLDTPGDGLPLDAAVFQDIQVRYQFTDTIELVGGVDNIEDEFVRYGGGFDDTGSFTNGAIYDAIGRRFYAGARFTF